MGGKRNVQEKVKIPSSKSLKRKSKNLKNKKKRFIRKERKHAQSKEIAQPQEEVKTYYRYSIAYDSGRYNKTFRAEVYTDKPLNERQVKARLDRALFHHVSRTNKGLLRMYQKSTYVGFEATQVSAHEKGFLQTNRIYYEIA